MDRKWKIVIGALAVLSGYLFYPIAAPFVENRHCEFKGVSEAKQKKIRHEAENTIAYIRKRAAQERRTKPSGVYTLASRTGGLKTILEFVLKQESANHGIIALHEVMTRFGGVFNGVSISRPKGRAYEYGVYLEYKMAPFYYASSGPYSFLTYIDPKTLIGRWGSVKIRINLDKNGQPLSGNRNSSLVIFHPTFIERGVYLLDFKGGFLKCPPIPLPLPTNTATYFHSEK